MPHTESAKKRVKQYAKRRALNKDKRSAMKSWMKKVMSAVAEGNKEKARTELSLAKKKIDKAARHRVIHPNTASRRKSLLDRAVGKM